ncbi:MAG: MaoC family dehydratase N-terminal domain-containing protein [Dehalococcoidia bacterium]
MVEQETETEAAEGGHERQLTDEMIALAKTRVGARLTRRNRWNTEASASAIRHYAQAHGMDNPLYSDPDYAAKTRWKTIIAPPTFQETVGIVPKGEELTPEERERARDALSGIHAWYAGTHNQWLLPVRPDDVLIHRSYQGDYIEKRSEFTGRTVLDYTCDETWNQRGELVARRCNYSIRGGRQNTWGERKKYAEIEPQTYTPEELEKIWADYERMEVRGAEPRYWEDVQVGDELTPTVYGPLTVTDMLASASAIGLQMTGSLAFKSAYNLRKTNPRMWMLNEHGIPDVIEAVHWDPWIARTTGNPMPYDYGTQRIAFTTHVITNWMGDEGWLRSLASQIRRFVYIGDTEWAKGRVTGKRIENGDSIVELDVWTEDQRGRVTAPSRAEVMLPSREHGPVQLPPKFAAPPPGWYAQ